MPTPRSPRQKFAVLTGMDDATDPIDDTALINRYITFRCNSGKRPWRPKTVQARTWALKSISSWMRQAPGLEPATMLTMTRSHVERWRLGLSGAPETVHALVSTMRGLGRWMVIHELRSDDPTVTLECPIVPPAQPRPIDSREYDLALACALAYPEIYLMLGLMGCCGLRCCEIAWLRTLDVEHLDNGGLVLHVIGKGGKRRPVPTGKYLAASLTPFLAAHGPVFTRPSDGEAYRPDGVGYHVNRFLRSVGCTATAHQLRHRFGTDYHELDPDLYRQATIMGHASVNTTQRYTLISPLEAAEYIERMSRRRLRRAS